MNYFATVQGSSLIWLKNNSFVQLNFILVFWGLFITDYLTRNMLYGKEYFFPRRSLKTLVLCAKRTDSNDYIQFFYFIQQINGNPTNQPDKSSRKIRVDGSTSFQHGSSQILLSFAFPHIIKKRAYVFQIYVFHFNAFYPIFRLK